MLAADPWPVIVIIAFFVGFVIGSWLKRTYSKEGKLRRLKEEREYRQNQIDILNVEIGAVENGK